jgi:hypothetical protein
MAMEGRRGVRGQIGTRSTGHRLKASEIRATAERLAKLAEAAEFPFDGTWCGFRPDASWDRTRSSARPRPPRAVARSGRANQASARTQR